MVQLADLDVSNNHPLALELTSLRTTVARFQDEAHTTSIKLQRHSLDVARTHDRLSLLERENDVLRKEVAVLRANPHPDTSPDFHPATSQVRQLTLSLRQLSDKLTHTEDVLLARTAELARTQDEAKKAKHTADGASEIVTHMLRQEEAHTLRERELQLKLRTVEEQMKMSDLVTKEYADLVRRLEGKLAAPSHLHERSPPSKTEENRSQRISNGPSRSYEEGKHGLQRLVSEFAEESERLQREIIRLQNELAVVEAREEAQKRSIEEYCLELAKAQTELQKLKIDDSTAAKMVSRYMKFSQASTDTLQGALSSLKARHASTVDTLSIQMTSLTSQIRDAEVNCERLRGALDELGGDYMKESYGRRREVALRIKLINREESLMESLRRWILRAQESLVKAPNVSPQESLTKMVNDAKAILFYNDSPVDGPPSGSLARIISAQMAADSLVKELHAESASRLELQKALAIGQQDQPPSGINGFIYQENSTQCDVSSSSVAIQASVLQSDEPMVISPLVIGLESAPDHPNDIGEQIYASHISVGTDAIQVPIEDGVKENVDFIDAKEGHMEEHNLEHLADVGDHSALRVSDPTVVQTKDTALPTPLPEIIVANVEEVPHSLLFSAVDKPLAVHREEHRTNAVSLSNIPLEEQNVVDGDTIDSTATLDIPVQPLPLPTLDILLQLQHPLLAGLAKVDHRYDELQRAFHDCHFALDALKQSLATTSLHHRIPPDALGLALERLNDYVEDARVELEIRTADESLLARGYETLLSVPGALASPDPGSTASENPTPSRSEIEKQIEAFVFGTEPIVQKAHENLTHKLSDVQHDIAILKRAIHDNQDNDASSALSEEFTLSSSSSPLFRPGPATAPVAGSQNGGWAPWIRSPSSCSSSPAPTFGNVMTSPRPRHSPLLNSASAGRPSKPYAFSGAGGSSKDPLASLGLKVPMPTFVSSKTAVHHPTPRSWTVPTVYMIGLGARTTSGSLTSLLSPQRIPEIHTTEAESDEGGGVSDVE